MLWWYSGGQKGWHVFYHFVGAVPGSTELLGLLCRLLYEMKSVPVSNGDDQLIIRQWCNKAYWLDWFSNLTVTCCRLYLYLRTQTAVTCAGQIHQPSCSRSVNKCHGQIHQPSCSRSVNKCTVCQPSKCNILCHSLSHCRQYYLVTRGHMTGLAWLSIDCNQWHLLTDLLHEGWRICPAHGTC